MIDIKNLFREFETFVHEDIKEKGKPAFMYNYLHESNVINTMDLPEQWERELASLKQSGYSERLHEKKIRIKGKKMKVRIHTLQPIKDGKFDMDTFQKSSIFPNDPLGMAIGYMITGFCYIEFLDSTAVKSKKKKK